MSAWNETEFELPSLADWQAKTDGQRVVDDPLERRLAGLELPLLLTEDEGPDAGSVGMPGHPPYLRGRDSAAGTWPVAGLVDDPDPAEAAAQVVAGTQGGLDEAWLALDAGLAAAIRTRAGRGPRLEDDATARAFVAGLGGDTCDVVLEAGACALPLGRALRSASDGPWRGGILGEPLSAVLRSGTLGLSLDEAFVDLSRHVDEMADDGHAASLAISTEVLHDAGAHAVDELAFALAATTETWRRLEKEGLELARLPEKTWLVLPLGRDLLLSTAKVRAARALWSHHQEAAGVDGPPPRIHARSALRDWAEHDPWTNAMRGTVSGLAAVLGGADSVAVRPFDQLRGRGSTTGRRLAANTGHLLREETDLASALDPAGGSWALEGLTAELCRRSWKRFQEIERSGGWLGWASDDRLRETLTATAEERRRAVARLAHPLTGTSTNPAVLSGPLPELAPLPLPPTTAPTWGEHFADRGSESAPVLELARLPEPFDDLRARASRQSTPSIRLLRIGPYRDHAKQAAAASGLIRALGWPIEEFTLSVDEEHSLDPENFLTIACATDEVLAERLPHLLAQADDDARLRVAVAAASPPDGLKVFACLHPSDDVPAQLTELLDRLEVSR
ncbi:MAG: methylmalonyl-CoA mutase family protein [Acidobacteriota bacterium]